MSRFVLFAFRPTNQRGTHDQSNALPLCCVKIQLVIACDGNDVVLRMPGHVKNLLLEVELPGRLFDQSGLPS